MKVIPDQIDNKLEELCYKRNILYTTEHDSKNFELNSVESYTDISEETTKSGKLKCDLIREDETEPFICNFPYF